MARFVSCLVLSLAILGVARTAAADERVCYSGHRTSAIGSQHTTSTVIVVREVDRAANEIRQHTWSDDDFPRDHTTVFAIDPKTIAKTVMFELRSDVVAVRGKGTLEGKPWQWTGYHATTKNGPMTMASEGHVSAKTFETTARLERGGQVAAMFHLEAKAFDCRDLARRRRALAPTDPHHHHPPAPTVIRT